MSLRVVPLSFDSACALVAKLHRHHEPPLGHKSSAGLLLDRRIVGAVIASRPIARVFDEGLTIEVTRLATDGTENACSMLYRAVWRSAKPIGYRRLITYTQADESGASLRAAGFVKVAELPPRKGWNTPSRPRALNGTENVPRILWEIVAADAPPFPDLRDVIRYEMGYRLKRPRCLHCRKAMPEREGRGRPRVFCTAAHKQAAYRSRTRTPGDAEEATDG